MGVDEGPTDKFWSAAALPDVPPAILCGQLQHQSVDGSARLGERRARSLGNGGTGNGPRSTTALIDKGADIEFVDPKPDLPDLVFTANAAIVLDGKALLSRFRHPERKREEPVFAGAFDALQAQAQLDSVEALPGDIVLEGAGDCIWDAYRRQFWMGCGQRSDRAACGYCRGSIRRRMRGAGIGERRASITSTRRSARCPRAT